MVRTRAHVKLEWQSESAVDQFMELRLPGDTSHLLLTWPKRQTQVHLLGGLSAIGQLRLSLDLDYDLWLVFPSFPPTRPQ